MRARGKSGKAERPKTWTVQLAGKTPEIIGNVRDLDIARAIARDVLADRGPVSIIDNDTRRAVDTWEAGTRREPGRWTAPKEEDP